MNIIKGRGKRGSEYPFFFLPFSDSMFANIRSKRTRVDDKNKT